jgi:hypothetical protein
VAALVASYSAAQTGNIDDDLQRAQRILNQLATGSLRQDMRTPLEEELARIEAYEYVVPVKLTARKYTAGSGYFPVTVSKAGLLDPPLVGRIVMPKGTARRAKSQLNPARATLRVRQLTGAVTRKLVSVWVTVDGKVWQVDSSDARLVSDHRTQDTPSQSGGFPTDSTGLPAVAVLNVPGQFATIQEAVEATPANGVIVLAAGTYEERVVITTPLTIRGAGRDSTFLTHGIESIVWLKDVEGVRLLDMTIDGQGTAETGVRSDSSRVRIERVRVTGVAYGVFLASGEGTLLDVAVDDIEHTGVNVNGATATVEGCRFSGVRKIAVDATNARVSVLRCTISECGEGLSLVGAGTTAVVDGNRITECGIGISFVDGNTATVRRNLLARNGDGVRIGHHQRVDMGTADSPGLNQLFSNANLNISFTPVNQTDTLAAQGNWWGISPPAAAGIAPGVIYTPFLTQPPNTAGQWTLVTQLPLREAVQCVAVTDSGAIYAGQYAGQVHRISRDNMTVEPSIALFEGKIIEDIATVGDVAFVCTGGDGVWRSKDFGDSWHRVGPHISVAAVAEVLGARLYIGYNAGVSWTDDLGETWESSTTPHGANVTAIVSVHDDLYAGARALGGVYMRDLSIGSMLPIGLAGQYITFLGRAGDRLYAVGNGAYATSDQGVTWIPIPEARAFQHDGPDVYKVSWPFRIERWSDAEDNWGPVTGELPESVTLPVQAFTIRNSVAYVGTDDGTIYAHRVSEPAGIPQVEGRVVHIPDPNLEAAIREVVGHREDDLTSDRLASLDEFRAENLDIADLTGLEFAVNLRTLGVSHNANISDLSPLAGLVHLERLEFSHSGVADLRPLANLPALKWLDVLRDNARTIAESLCP